MDKQKIAELNNSRIATLVTPLRPLVNKLLTNCEKSGYQLFITQAVRTVDEQNKLYASGRTKPGNVVTWVKGGYSWHNWGCAVDVVFITNGDVNWNGNWNAIGTLGQQLELTWGGAWKKKPDRPHFEYHPGINMLDARNKTSKWNNFIQEKPILMPPIIVKPATTIYYSPKQFPPKPGELESKVSAWAVDAQKWVMSNNISDGDKPDQLVSREEVWTMLHRAKGVS